MNLGRTLDGTPVEDLGSFASIASAAVEVNIRLPEDVQTGRAQSEASYRTAEVLRSTLLSCLILLGAGEKAS